MGDDIPVASCEVCGEPMPPGETMFKYHGYSGPCPKPPKPKPTVEAMIEYVHRRNDAGFWLVLRVNRVEERALGPFDTDAERQRVHDDMLEMMRSCGAKDVPPHVQ